MITESSLYCMAMESDTAYRLMPQLCELLGYPFPPRLEQPVSEKRETTPDPFLTVYL